MLRLGTNKEVYAAALQERSAPPASARIAAAQRPALHSPANFAWRRTPMPKGYWVTCYHSISDPQKLAAYAKLAPAATAPFGGRYLVRGTPSTTFEAGRKERIVISEFPSIEKAVAAYNSPAYQEALKALGDGAVRDIRIVEGLE
jgi:uncharacterized protein (DUF1330 family)